MRLIGRQRQRDQSAEVKWAAAYIDDVGKFGRRIVDDGYIPWIEVRGDLFNNKKLCKCLGVGCIDSQRIERVKLSRWRVEGASAVSSVIRLIYPFLERQRLVAQLIDPSRSNPTPMTIRVIGWKQRARSFWTGLKKRFRRV